MEPEELIRAGRIVQQRIIERGKTPTDVAHEAGIDPKTLRALIRGERWPTRVISHLEAALDWPPGEIYRRASDGVEGLSGYTDRELLHELLARARKRDPANTLNRAG